MRIQRLGVVLVLVGLAGLHVVLAVLVATRSPMISALFIVSALALLAGIGTRRQWPVAAGLLAGIAAPLLVGLLGLEPFAASHHLLRAAVFAVIMVWWAREVNLTCSTTSS